MFDINLYLSQCIDFFFSLKMYQEFGSNKEFQVKLLKIMIEFIS